MGVIWRQRGGRTLPTYAALLALTGATFAACALLGADAVRHVVSIGAAVIFLRAVTIVGRTSTLGQQEMQIAYGLSALPAVAAVERAVARTAVLDGAPPPVGQRGAQITFEGVAFRYPGTETPVLKGLDLSIPPSRSLAVVGANGAGKTTLVKLACRFYDPDQGAVRVDGIDLRRLDAHSWQRQVAAVFQDFQRFELPARDNIGFGATALAGDQEALEHAAAAAGILGRIRSLPSGWDTPLARHLAGGADLSGGEWQRVALARAMLAVEAGARLLILDEPTASLDIRAEAVFYSRFLELTREVTTIVVSHRFSTVRRADLICVLDNGAVAELGSHEQLMAADGRYARMYAAQSARFDVPGLSRPAPDERA
jgi:ATP-binding cassette subfamily B protein